MDGLYSWVLLYGGVVLGLTLMDWMVGAAFWLARSRLDHAHPDDLPLTAGQFAIETAQQQKLPVRVLAVVSDKKGTDAFFPSARTVTLTTHTFVKRDPTCWAIAAHELGHAQVHLKGPVVAVILQGARALSGLAKALGSTALLGNLAFASPELSRLAFGALLVSLGATALVLVDEAAASLLALRTLAEDGRLTPARMKTARQVLTAAFATYVANLAGQILLLAAWQRLDAIALERSFEPAAPLSGGQAAFALLLAAGVLSAVFVGVMQAMQAKPQPAREAQGDLLRGVLVVLLLWWVWDQPLAPGMPVACVLAVLGARLAVAIVLSPAILCIGIPLMLLLMPVLFGIIALAATFHQEPDHGPGFEARQAEAAKASAAQLEEVAQAAARSPSWILRAGRLLELAAPVPLAILVFWSLAS